MSTIASSIYPLFSQGRCLPMPEQGLCGIWTDLHPCLERRPPDVGADVGDSEHQRQTAPEPIVEAVLTQHSAGKLPVWWPVVLPSSTLGYTSSGAPPDGLVD